ncbi:ATP-binding protein [Ramlibacter sp. AN1133]|uniref:ATP-binding protein n=1 Tax=Ramlibacter sp. AN1133 TaxID=3133429 RepID=UPI0030BB9664
MPVANGEAGLEGGARPSVERRQLTVMFCDLVGSTRLSLELDAEDFTEAVSGYRDACARVVRRWRGFISRYVGDGVLVYFGYPRAAEDDALRAVAAAWELSRTIAELNVPDAAGSRTGPPLQSRIGLHTGLAVVGDVVGRESHESDGALGAVPNIAARLQAMGRPGEVIISESTAALLPPTITLRALDRLPERADFGQVQAFCVVHVPRDLESRRPLSASGLVGRQGTLERLAKVLRDDDGGGAAALFVCGEAGVGKSRVVRELIVAPEAAAPLQWVQVACSAYGQLSPLDPFRAWVHELEAAGPALDPAGASADLTPYDRRRRIFQELRAALWGGTSAGALLIEDLHWADSMTVEFLAELLAEPPRSLLAIVMTSREPPHEVLASAGRLHVETLERLSPGDAASLARGIDAPRPLTALELAQIVEQADGVPLFIEEFVRAMSARQAGADGIPITLRDSLMGALDTLGAGRTVALCASVFGRGFEYRQLQALLGLDDDALVTALSALVRARVLVQLGEPPNAWFEFRHALLRDTAYHTLLKSERARWHRRVAELARAGILKIEDSMPELLATHHSLGGNYRGAIEYWLRAQERAMQRSAYVEALAHLRSALGDCGNLALEEPTDSDRLELELLRRITAPLIAISGWTTPELEVIYARAMQLCSVTGTSDVEFEVERGLHNMHLLRSDLSTADAVAERLVATARSEPERERRETLLLVALRCKALPAFYRGDFSSARRSLLEVLSLYDPVRDAGHTAHYATDPVMFAMAYLAWMDAVDGDAAGARARADAALEHARSERHVFSVCYASCFAASVAQLCGDTERAAHHAAEALRLGNQHNFQYWIAWAQAIGGWLVGLQSPQEGIALIDDAVDRYRATGSTLVVPYFEALACRVARAAGLPDAGDREARLHQHAQATGVRFWQPVLLEPAAACS